jgi:hypothetical protein
MKKSLALTFYLRHSHAEVSSQVTHSLKAYLQAVGPTALGLSADEEGYWQSLDDAGWGRIWRELSNPRRASIHLTDASNDEQRYRFIYRGRQLDAAFLANEPGAVSAVSFWLPTGYLEEHGPEKVRELALELAALLPFSSGHAGLSFDCDTGLAEVKKELRQLCFRYPGMDIPDFNWLSLHLGTRIRGVSWLNFLGQPVLGELGGAASLRARLHHPKSTVQELSEDRAVIIMGPWPEAGDIQKGEVLPAYREAAHVLAPWLYHATARSSSAFSPEDLLRWERRFLD